MATSQNASIAAVSNRRRIRKKFTLPTRAKQSFKDECDINVIMAKYRARGIVSHVTRHQGVYTDLPSEIDYHTNLNSVMEANEAFASLPAKIRSRFHNNPAEFLGFVQDPKNQSEIDEMGLGLNPPEVTTPEPTPAPAPAPAPTPDPPANP